MTTNSLARPLPDGVSDTFIRPCLECGSTVQVLAGVEQPHEHKVLDDGDGTPSVYAWWQGYDASTARAEAAETKLLAVLALHVPWYEVNGVRHDHVVPIYGAPPKDHVCRVGFTTYDNCLIDPEDPEESEHYVLACNECRCATDEAQEGYLLWPCATVRALATKDGQ